MQVRAIAVKQPARRLEGHAGGFPHNAGAPGGFGSGFDRGTHDSYLSRWQRVFYLFRHICEDTNMHPWFQDIRYALRILAKSPGLSAVIVLSLAIGIGANTAIFSVVDALLLRPLPYPEPDRLAVLWLRSPGINIPQDWPSPGQYLDIQNENRSFEELSIARGDEFNLTGRAEPERLMGLRTSSSLFHLLGAKPLFGRLLMPEDDRPGQPRVAVLTHAVWQRLFGGDPGIVGKGITLDKDSYTVAGVLRP